MALSINLKFIFILLVVVMGAISCISWKKRNYSDFKRAVLNKKDIRYFEILFVQTESKGTLGYLSAFDLRRELLNGKEFKNYDLDSLLNKIHGGAFTFNCESLAIDCFELSSYISESYAKQPFKTFLSCYTEYDKERQEYVVQHQLSKDEKLTVIYFLYLNGYYTKYDNYENCYFVTKGIKKPAMEVLDPKDIKLLE